jgi:hypothetical protein
VHDTEPRRFESGPAREVFSKKTTRGSDTSPRRSTPNSYKQRRRLKSRPLAEKIILCTRDCEEAACSTSGGTKWTSSTAFSAFRRPKVAALTQCL